MRRVLFIAYLYPPIANSGTRRSLCFANHLPDNGWDPLILTVANPAPRHCEPALLDEVRPGLRVERAALSSGAISRAAVRWIPGQARRERLASAIAWRLEHLAVVPDELALWYPSAVRRAVALHREVGFDAVYASGWPWTSFMVARAVAMRIGCPYVLDYRDLWKPTGTHEWETPNRSQLYMNPRLERVAARRAAAVITVTPSLVEAIARDTGRNDVRCITNGFEPTDFPAASVVPGTVHDEVRISYTGVWRPGYGLQDLYSAIAELKRRGSPHLRRLRVSAAGFAPGPAKQFDVAEFVDELGPVPHERALQLMQSADALYLSVPLGFYANASLPGKLFEYLGSGRPIIAVVPAESEVSRVVGDVGGSMRVEPGDVQTVADLIEGLCAGRGAELFGPQRRERLERYTRASTTRELAAVLDEVTRQARGVAA